MDAEKLPKSLRRFADKIADIEDYRSGDEGFWVHLASGWRTPDGETHSIHENTITECVREMKHVVRCTVRGCCEKGDWK